MLDIDKNPVIFSAGTKLAYRINERYYRQFHYCWCAKEFDSTAQAPTSNPQTIINEYLKLAITGDRHIHCIEEQIRGILKGAKSKLEGHVINQKQYHTIVNMVYASRFCDYAPMLYVVEAFRIPMKRIKMVDPSEAASSTSEEYRIEKLKQTEFKIIDYSKLLMPGVGYCEEELGAVADKWVQHYNS